MNTKRQYISKPLAIEFCSQKNSVLIISGDKKIYEWEINTTKVTEKLILEAGALKAIFTPDLKYAIKSSLGNSQKGNLTLHNLNTKESKPLLKADSGKTISDSINTIYCSQKNYILISTQSGQLTLHAPDGALLSNYPQQAGIVFSAVISEDHTALLTGSSDKVIRLWKIPSLLFKDFIKLYFLCMLSNWSTADKRIDLSDCLFWKEQYLSLCNDLKAKIGQSYNIQV